MREISSKEYAEGVEDVILMSLGDALDGAFAEIAERFGFKADIDGAFNAFHLGFAATWRDQAIELFERYGMDITSDGRDY